MNKYEYDLMKLEQRIGEIACFATAKTISEISPLAARTAKGTHFDYTATGWDKETGEEKTFTLPTLYRGDGRTVSVLKNPMTGMWEVWGSVETRRDREIRETCEPRFNSFERYEMGSTLEPERRKRTVRIAREDRCTTALQDAKEADEAAEAEEAAKQEVRA